MAKEYKIEIVLDGNKSVLKDFNELESAYMKIYGQMQANKLETKLDEKTMKQNIADLAQLETAAMKMGRTLKESTAGVPQQWEQINGQIYKVTQSIDAAGVATKKYEAAVLPSQRAVTSGFNATSNALNQLSREAPAFAVSASTGFLAISNNLPILFDALGQAKAQGKSVFGELTKGLFSWGTALSVGVTLLTVYGGSIVKWITAPSTAAAAKIAELARQTKLYNDVVEDSSKIIGKETAKLDILFGALNEINTTKSEQRTILKQINEEYDGYLTKLDIETVTIDNQTDAYARLMDMIYQVSIAKAATAAFEEFNTKIISSFITSEKAAMDFNEAMAASTASFTEEQNRRFNELQANGVKAGDAYSLIKNAADAGTIAQTNNLNSLQETMRKTANETVLLGIDAKKTGAIFDNLFGKGRDSQLGRVVTNLRNVFDQFFKFTTNSFSQKGSSAARKTEKDFRQFGENLTEVTKEIQTLLSEDLINPAEYAKGLSVFDDLTAKYLATIKGNTDDVNKAIAENLLLEAEQTKLSKDKYDAEQRLNKERKLAVGLLLKGKSIDNDGRSVISLDGKTVDEAKALVADIVESIRKGNISVEEGIKQMLSRGVSLEFIQKEAKIVNDSETKMMLNRKKIEDNQRLIDKGGGDDLLREKRKLLEQRNKFETDYGKQRENILKYQLKKEAEAADAARKAEIEAGLDDFNKFTMELDSKFSDSMKAINASSDAALKQSNSLVEGLVTLIDGKYIIDYNAYGAALQTLSASDAEILETQVGILEKNADNIIAITAKRDADLKNSAVEFTDKYIQIYRELNAAQLREAGITAELSIQELEHYGEDEYNRISSQVEKRRELKKKQSDEEIYEIRKSFEKAKQANQFAFQRLYEIEIAQEQKEIDLVKAKGSSVVVRQKELDKKRIDLIRQFKQEEEKIYEDYEALFDKNNKKSMEERINDWTAVIQAAQDFANALIDFARQQNQNTIDQLNIRLQNTEEQYSQTLNRISSLEDELEGKRSGRRDAVLQSLELEREREIKLAKEKIALADRIAKEERKIRKREQAAAIAESIINGALAITNVLATTPPPLSFVLAGIMAATTAVQTATIASQKFAKGGFTGSGGQRDETGHKVAGVVHNDEWVAPKWMVESPKFGGVINQLENARAKGFANGGFTSPDFNSLSQSVTGNSTAKLESMMRSYMETNIQLANRPLFVSATEVQNVNTNAKIKKASVTI